MQALKTGGNFSHMTRSVSSIARRPTQFSRDFRPIWTQKNAKWLTESWLWDEVTGNRQNVLPGGLFGRHCILIRHLWQHVFHSPTKISNCASIGFTCRHVINLDMAAAARWCPAMTEFCKIKPKQSTKKKIVSEKLTLFWIKWSTCCVRSWFRFLFDFSKRGEVAPSGSRLQTWQTRICETTEDLNLKSAVQKWFIVRLVV